MILTNLHGRLLSNSISVYRSSRSWAAFQSRYNSLLLLLLHRVRFVEQFFVHVSTVLLIVIRSVVNYSTGSIGRSSWSRRRRHVRAHDHVLQTSCVAEYVCERLLRFQLLLLRTRTRIHRRRRAGRRTVRSTRRARRRVATSLTACDAQSRRMLGRIISSIQRILLLLLLQQCTYLIISRMQGIYRTRGILR